MYHKGHPEIDDHEETRSHRRIPNNTIGVLVKDNNYLMQSTQNNYVFLFRFSIVSINDLPFYDRLEYSKKQTLQRNITYLLNAGNFVYAFVKMELTKEQVDTYIEKCEEIRPQCGDSFINDFEITQLAFDLANPQYIDAQLSIGKWRCWGLWD
jgi:hypothetical protein